MPRYRYLIYPDGNALATAVAARFVAAAREAMADHDRFHVALAGGSTPRALYRCLAAEPYRDEVDWSRVAVFFGDERSVPPAHAESNYRMARESLLDHVPIPAAQIHRMQGELTDLSEAAQAYAEELAVLPRDASGMPVFDLILLGMGEDGHTASLFPGTTILDERTAPAAAVYVEKLATWRISLTLPVLDAASRVELLVTGENKRRVVAEIMAADGPVRDYPVSWLTPRPGLLWHLDAAAAGELEATASEDG